MSSTNNTNNQPSDYDLQAALDASYAMSQASNNTASAPASAPIVPPAQVTNEYDIDAAIEASKQSYRIECLRNYVPSVAFQHSPLREWTKDTEPVLVKCCICTYDVPANTLKYFVCGHGMCKTDCLPGFKDVRCPECRTPIHRDFTLQAMVLSTNFYLEEKAKKEKERAFLEEAMGSHISSHETFESDDETETDSDFEVISVTQTNTKTTKRTIESSEEITVFKSNKKPYNVHKYSETVDEKPSANADYPRSSNPMSNSSPRFVAAPAPTVFNPMPLDINDPFAALNAPVQPPMTTVRPVASPTPASMQSSGLDEELQPENTADCPDNENEKDVYVKWRKF